jgi:hypothetical protein
MSENREVNVLLTHVIQTWIMGFGKFDGEVLESHIVIGYDGERWFYLSVPKTHQVATEIAKEAKNKTAWVNPDDYLTEADLTQTLVNLAED